ncbi:MAG: ribosomal L7Ae/L30e/S12e/Gadd45 family protein [Oscillospiraceae bacterium]|nr:ribosomal L7Ae/L30e/S12e/Gadd45 family protein [Oscillospiraceae bacterium]
MKLSYAHLSNLGLCRKAGKLALGFDACVEAMKKDEAKGILTASDLSLKTLKEVKFNAEKTKTEIVYLPADMHEINKAIGKHTGVLAVLDEGLFSLFK